MFLKFIYRVQSNEKYMGDRQYFITQRRSEVNIFFSLECRKKWRQKGGGLEEGRRRRRKGDSFKYLGTSIWPVRATWPQGWFYDSGTICSYVLRHKKVGMWRDLTTSS